MSDSAAPHLVDLRDLRLDTAHALVAQVTGSGAAPSLDRSHPRQYLQGVIDGLCELSLKDPLTGLANRRHFRAVLEREIDRVTRSGEAALLLMLDIDHFKKVNDTHGHVMGDRVLQAVGQVFKSCVASGSATSVARYGGEEFAILMPASTPDDCLKQAELVRLRTQALKIRDRRTQTVVLTVTLSAGLAWHQAGDDARSLTARADAALYRSKQEGRNRVTCG